MIKSKNFRQFAENLADLSRTAPGEIDRYIKAHNVCFKVGADVGQFQRDLQLCTNANRTDLIEYIVGRDMHTAFALWAFYRKPADIIGEFFKKESTQAAIALMTLNSMK